MSDSQLKFRHVPSHISTAKPVLLEWSSNISPLELDLRYPGQSTDQLAENLTGSDYTWTPSTSLLNGKYTVQVLSMDNTLVYDEAYTTLDHNKTDAIVSTSSQISRSRTATNSSTSELQSSLDPVTTKGTGWGNSVSASSAPVDTQPDLYPATQHTIGHGAIAGIAVGAVTLLILILASAILCWRRRRQSSQSAIPELPNNQTDADIKTDPSATIWVPELDQDGAVYGPHELPGTPPPLEEPLEATETSPAKGRVVEIGDPE